MGGAHCHRVPARAYSVRDTAHLYGEKTSREAEAVASRRVLSGWLSMPVLRHEIQESDSRPHRAALTQGSSCLGECCQRVHPVQPQEGRLHAA